MFAQGDQRDQRDDQQQRGRQQERGRRVIWGFVHRSRYLAATAARIWSSAPGSSIVVRSPGSRPSQIAWIDRRSSLPERVFGSAVTKCTRAGRATAPSCVSTTFITSPSSASRSAVEPTRLVSLTTANAIATWPLS